MTAPVVYPPGAITSPFGERVFGGRQHFHEGVDFRVRGDAPGVPAAVDGIVTQALKRGGGLIGILSGVDGRRYLYGHLGGVRTGRVSRGEPFAVGANTGLMTTGPHIHVGVFENGQAIDPLSIPHVRAAPEAMGRRLTAAAIGVSPIEVDAMHSRSWNPGGIVRMELMGAAQLEASEVEKSEEEPSSANDPNVLHDNGQDWMVEKRDKWMSGTNLVTTVRNWVAMKMPRDKAFKSMSWSDDPDGSLVAFTNVAFGERRLWEEVGEIRWSIHRFDPTLIRNVEFKGTAPAYWLYIQFRPEAAISPEARASIQSQIDLERGIEYVSQGSKTSGVMRHPADWLNFHVPVRLYSNGVLLVDDAARALATKGTAQEPGR